jgi:hypothetical protein
MGFFKKLFKGIGKVAKVVAPILPFIPGVGTGAAALVGALGGASDGGGLGGAVRGAAGSYLGAGGKIGGTLGKVMPYALQSYDTAQAENQYNDSLKSYMNIVNGGVRPYNYTPQEFAAYRGASDRNIQDVADQRTDKILSNLGRRGMLDSGLAPSAIASLANWQDSERARADAAMYDTAYNRGAGVYRAQIAGNAFNVKNRKEDAMFGSKALADTLATQGAVQGYSPTAPAATPNPYLQPDYQPITKGYDEPLAIMPRKYAPSQLFDTGKRKASPYALSFGGGY